MSRLIKLRRRFGVLAVGDRFRVWGDTWVYRKTGETSSTSVSHGMNFPRAQDDLVYIVLPGASRKPKR